MLGVACFQDALCAAHLAFEEGEDFLSFPALLESIWKLHTHHVFQVSLSSIHGLCCGLSVSA